MGLVAALVVVRQGVQVLPALVEAPPGVAEQRQVIRRVVVVELAEVVALVEVPRRAEK
jgi:hypothetical protein